MRYDISGCDPFQQDVINELSGRNIIVGASAGAGKTRVLVTRIMKRIINDRIPVSRIMALTFTAAAAEEMKNRLAEELYLSRSLAETKEDEEYLDEQITLLSTACITTIDSWCLDVIKKYYNVIGLDPATTANVISEGRHTQLQQEAFRRAAEAMCADEEGRKAFLELASCFSPRPEDYETIYTIVDKLLLQAESETDPEEWLRKAEHTYVPFASLRQLPDHVRKEFFAVLKQRCLDLKTRQESILEILKETDDKALKPEMITAALNKTNDCLRRIEEEDYEGWRNNLYELALIKEKKPKTEHLIPLHTDMRAMIDSLLEISYPEKAYAANSAVHARLMHTLVELTSSVRENLHQLMMENKALYFSDMERYALEILQKQDGRAAKLISASLDEIMIDEFQDTSELQDSILRMIARDKPVFRVGDVKQSIYRFRKARPQLMRDLMADPGNAVFNLRYNYRSNSRIVEFTNLLFERLMNIPGISDTYGPSDHVSAGSDRQRTDLDEPHVHLALIINSNPESKKDGTPKKLPAAKVKALKAEWIAEKILSLHQEKGMRWGSFAVLAKSHEDQKAVRAAFEKCGIPFDIDTKEGFYRSDLCMDILSLLKVLADPADEISLAAVLTSVLFGCSDEELAAMVLKHRKLSIAVNKEYGDIAAVLESLRAAIPESGVTGMLRLLCRTVIRNSDTCWYDALREQDRANFDYLYEKTAASDDDLYSLIEEMEVSSDEKSSEAITVGKEDDVVTAATIHHSKGLQYDCVFLWGTGSALFRDTGNPLLTGDVIPAAFRDIDPETRIVMPTVQRIAAEERLNREDLEEFTRLLYVAVTRAKEQLYIVDTEDSCQEYRPHLTIEDLKKRTGITGLLCMALDHREGITENGLLETVYENFTGLSEEHLIPVSAVSQSETRPHMVQTPQLLPEIVVPSALEKRPQENGLPPLDLSGTGGKSYGTSVHELIEQLPDDAEWTEEMIRSIDPEAPDAAVRSVLAFGESELYQKARTMEIHKEYPFYYEDASMRMNGIMDFVAVGDDEVILIDFKTDRLSNEQIREIYAPQLAAYTKACEYFWPDKTVRTYAYSLHSNCPILL